MRPIVNINPNSSNHPSFELEFFLDGENGEGQEPGGLHQLIISHFLDLISQGYYEPCEAKSMTGILGNAVVLQMGTGDAPACSPFPLLDTITGMASETENFSTRDEQGWWCVEEQEEGSPKQDKKEQEGQQIVDVLPAFSIFCFVGNRRGGSMELFIVLEDIALEKNTPSVQLLGQVIKNRSCLLPTMVKQQGATSCGKPQKNATSKKGDEKGPTAEQQPTSSISPSSSFSIEKITVSFPSAPNPRLEFQLQDFGTFRGILATFEIELFLDKCPYTVSNILDLVVGEKLKNFYEELCFHRLVPGFVLQFGCPFSKELAAAGGGGKGGASKSIGQGGPPSGTSFPLYEATTLSCCEEKKRGGVDAPVFAYQPSKSKTYLRDAMGKIQDEFVYELPNVRYTLAMANAGTPNSAGSQFFINLKRNAQLDWFNNSTNSAHVVFGRVTKGFQVVDAMANVGVASAGKKECENPAKVLKVKRVKLL